MKKERKKALSMILIMALTFSVCSGLFFTKSAYAGTDIKWNFEDGTLGDFEIMSGSFGKLISDIPYAHNSQGVPYPREGNWHLSTLETNETYTTAEMPYYSEEVVEKMTKPTDAFIGVVRSPMFKLEEPTMNFLVGGGTNENVYVALCDQYGHELIKARNTQSGEEMARIQWDVTDYDLIGKYVFIKIVDNANSSWGHITFDDFNAVGIVDTDAEILPEPAPDIIWSFEDGVLAPFKVTEGQFSDDLIVSWNVDRNDQVTPVQKDGNYYLSTVELDGVNGGTGHYNEAYVGAICSPKFMIQGPEITLRLGGGTNSGNYVALCRAADDSEVARVNVPKNGNVLNSVTLSLGDKYVKDEIVYIKIVDGTTAGYGYIQVDDIRAKGVVIGDKPSSYSDFKWSFEDGTIAPFTTTDTWGKLIVDRDLERNGSGTPMNKDGKYYLSTVEVEDPNSYNEGFTGSLRSPDFYLNPSTPKVSLRISGGAGGRNYVAVCDSATGSELKKVSPLTNGHPFSVVSIDLTGEYTEGQQVYVKIVDGTTSSWAFIQVDDIRFSGALPEKIYSKVRWSFENGTPLPFKTSDQWGQLIVKRDTDLNNNTTPLGKHGTYYLSTVMTSETTYNEAFTGSLKSVSFCLDPKDSIIKLKIAGGAAGGYVAVCDAVSGNELAKVAPHVNGHVFNEVTLDMTGKFNEGDLLYIKIADTKTSGWAFISVDDIRASIAFKEEQPISSATELYDLTGWNTQRFNKLKEMLDDLIDTFGSDGYPEGVQYKNEIINKQAELLAMLKNNVKPSDPVIGEFTKEMDELEYKTITSNPFLNASPILFVTRNQYVPDHHNTHNMFPSYAGEINSGYYTGGGAVKVIDFGNNSAVTTLKEDEDGVYRDPDISYDGNKMLISYKGSKEGNYSIYEYTFNEAKTAVESEKQLTSMKTADDMDPLYLPSGQIAFASTRDPKYVMCNRHISSNIYRMEADGANIVKITDSTLFERPTDVLRDGRILYDRWEYNDRDFGSAQGLWTVAPDGTQQVTYYGNNSPTGATIDAKQIPGTDTVIATLSSTHDRAWGAIGIIDKNKGVDGSDPVIRTWPDSAKQSIGDPNRNGNNIDAYVGLSIKYEDPQPLSSKYFIVSRQIKAGNEKTGLYLIDVFGNETLIYEDESGLGAFDANLIAPKSPETVISERRNYKDGPGSFFVQNVYEGTHMEGVEPGSVKTLRIVESMDKKYTSEYQQWGGEGQQNPGVNWHSFEVKRVIGEVPVYEDGSAYFEVPQDVFVYFQLLDENGKMIQSMRSGTLVQSGEQTGCIGCHEDRLTTPDTSNGQTTPQALLENVEMVSNPNDTSGSNEPKTIFKNTPDKPMKRVLNFASGKDELIAYDDETKFAEYTDLPSMNYLTEVQPIFTKNCISCHGYDKKEGNLTLVADKDVIFNASYMDLWRNRGKGGVYFGNLVGAIGGGDSAFTKAKAWGSYNSPLIKKITTDSAHASRLTDAEKRRIEEWVDLNATYYGDYCTNYGYNPGGRSPITQAERNALGDMRGLSWGANPYPLIYFDNPEKSPILAGKSGAAYDNALSIIKKGQDRLKNVPDVDWRGTETMPGNSSVAIKPWRMNKLDEWRTNKVKLRDAIEAANRAAIAGGTKRYDTDNTEKNGLPEWDNAFPGWPTENNPLIN